jgi:phage gp29-like protein
MRYEFSYEQTKTAQPKPPIGLKPRYISDKERIQEIDEAITRYMDAGLQIPEEWFKERNELIGRAK